jgi:hypothetical protein
MSENLTDLLQRSTFNLPVNFSIFNEVLNFAVKNNMPLDIATEYLLNVGLHQCNKQK